MIDAGVFDARPNAELLAGRVVAKASKTTAHDFGVGRFNDLLRNFLPDGWIVREEKSIVLDRWSRPRPDLVVVRGPWNLYRRRSPGTADLALVVEFADASYDADRGPKWRLYASAGIPAYAIVNIPARRVEFHGSPAGRGRNAVFRSEAIYPEEDEFPIAMDGVEVGRIAVRDVLA
jgi:Uma2 family endonuclease